MKPADRFDWIEDYLTERQRHLGETRYPVDVMDRCFSDDYIAQTGAGYLLTFYGANKCPQLGRDLSAMFDVGRLDRRVSGITDGYPGFPKWVYSYFLPKEPMIHICRNFKCCQVYEKRNPWCPHCGWRRK